QVPVEALGIDFCYSATQKCIGSPPGLSPITASERAREAMKQRKESPRSWYLDLSLLYEYWSSNRRYHHTAPVSNIYALREALRMILEEGLEARFRRHRRNGRALRAGLQALGLSLVVPEAYRADQLTSVFIPEGVPDLEVRRALLYEYGIEIGGGLGKFAGKVWRIGLMGESSKEAYVLALLAALDVVLPRHGYEVAPGVGVMEASKALAAER
ncbi:MAG: alanine--glyoxylate aminotransferase family protein, partial [Dehalococcoidia bacterium]|nr:alanine--glyoxylate aminotransferase family protein [Dehalococcoidia bacterium]